MRVDVTIDVKPQGKGRPRLSYGRIKTPEQTVIYENYIKLLYQSTVKQFFECPIKMIIKSYYPIAKSDSRKKQQQKLSGEIRPYNIKPDTYNVIVKSNYTSIAEGGKFINIAGKGIIDQHKNIKHNKILELKAPRCLEDGEVRIGDVKVKDNK